MITEEDKTWIRNIIKEEVAEALLATTKENTTEACEHLDQDIPYSDPHKEFRDHIANGGKVKFDYGGQWVTCHEPKFTHHPKHYHCVPIPTGESLVGKLCWISDMDCRTLAVENSWLDIISSYNEKAVYPYKSQTTSYKYAWPFTKAELEELAV